MHFSGSRPLLQWSLCECCRRCRVASRLIRKCRNRSWTGNSWPPALLSQQQIKSRPTRPPVPPTCGHFIQEKDGHAKQCNHFLVPFRKIKFRFVVGTQIEEAMQSGRSNLNAEGTHTKERKTMVGFQPLCFLSQYLQPRCQSVQRPCTSCRLRSPKGIRS